MTEGMYKVASHSTTAGSVELTVRYSIEDVGKVDAIIKHIRRGDQLPDVGEMTYWERLHLPRYNRLEKVQCLSCMSYLHIWPSVH